MDKQAFISRACRELTKLWQDCPPEKENSFATLFLLDRFGQEKEIDISSFYEALQLVRATRATAMAFLDAINILTYECRATDAVLGHHALYSRIAPGAHDSRSILAFSYHGTKGKRTNYRHILISDGRIVFRKSQLGKWAKPPTNVDQWFPYGYSRFQSLVPNWTLDLEMRQEGNKWVIVVNQMVLPDEYDSEQAARAVMTDIKTNADEFIENFNQQICEIRRERCPFNLKINWH